MKTSELLELDYSDRGSRDIIQKALRKIKPLSGYVDEEVPMGKVEKAATILSGKYGMVVRNISLDMRSGKYGTPVYRAHIVDEKTLNEIGVVFGICLYEIMAKVVILMYAKSRGRK